MLPSGERLSRTEFARTFETGRHYRGALVQLRIARRPVPAPAMGKPAVGKDAKTEPGGVRAAFVAGKKLGKAVVRNGLRRRIREQYRLSPWRQELALAGCDLVFMAAPAALTADSEQLRAALNELLERAKRENVRSSKPVSQGAAVPATASHGQRSGGRGRTVKRVWKQPASDVSSHDGQSRQGSGDAGAASSGGQCSTAGELGRGQAEAE